VTADMENNIIIVIGVSISVIMFSCTMNAFISNEELSSNIDTQGKRLAETEKSNRLRKATSQWRNWILKGII